MAKKIDPQQTRDSVLEIAEWIRGEEGASKPPRAALAAAVRLSARTVAEQAPGHSVELRVPPFVAVQCIDGPRHTRGTPPNVVECDPLTWLRVATGLLSFDEAHAQGLIDASGSRAGEIAPLLPVIPLRKP